MPARLGSSGFAGPDRSGYQWAETLRKDARVSLPPILFVHGAFSRAAHFAYWVDFFSGHGFECHAPSLPGHDPSDREALASLDLADYLAALMQVRDRLQRPPIVIGHSMGGLLAQAIAAGSPCAALVCVAAAPPGILTARLRALPHLLAMLPAILAGRVLRPRPSMFRRLALHDLPEPERGALAASLGAESGRAYRAMVLGLLRIDPTAIKCPVLCLSGGRERVITPRTAHRVAALYRARHIVFPDRGHWLIAASAGTAVCGAVLGWLREIGIAPHIQRREAG